MKISEINFFTGDIRAENHVKNTDEKGFGEFLSAAEKEKASAERSGENEAVMSEPHPCYKCEKREECELRKKIEEEQGPLYTAGYFPRNHRDNYTRYLVLSGAIEPAKGERGLTDYLNFFYNNFCPYDSEEE